MLQEICRWEIGFVNLLLLPLPPLYCELVFGNVSTPLPAPAATHGLTVSPGSLSECRDYRSAFTSNSIPLFENDLRNINGQRLDVNTPQTLAYRCELYQ